ncbi:MAG TPA: helix-turn-helix domain-containing protein [Candidatus Thermoplasmatota archaeon]|nr:helix-turn-helix domain-containing protein [Candidatus Thermoplasmatota archaeon]
MRHMLRFQGLRRLAPALVALLAVAAMPAAAAAESPPMPSLRLVEESDGTLVLVVDSNGLLGSEPTYVVAPAPAGLGGEAERRFAPVPAALRSLGDHFPALDTPEVDAALGAAMDAVSPALSTPEDSPIGDAAHAASDVFAIERQDGSGLGSARFEVTVTEAPAFGSLGARTGDIAAGALLSAPAALASDAAPVLAPAIRFVVPDRSDAPATVSTPKASSSTSTASVSAPARSGDDPVKIAAATAATGVLGLAAWILYHRIRESATLANATRKAIYDAVSANPGLGVQDLARVASVSYSTASYHLDRLVEARMLVLANEAGRLAYYKNGGAFTESERKVLPLLKNAEAMRVLEAILASPGTYRAALAESLGVTATTINWHLKRLVDAGLVVERREGRSARLFADRARLNEAFGPVLAKLDGVVADGAPALPELRRALATEPVAA